MQREPRPPAAASSRRGLSKELRIHGVVVPRPREVNDYLRKHAGLSEHAGSLCAQTRHEFGDSAELSLELYRDLEIDDAYLTLYVRQPAYETDFLARVDRVSEACSNDLAQISGQILITTDFGAPRGLNGV